MNYNAGCILIKCYGVTSMAKDYKPRAVKLPYDEYMIALWYIRGYNRRKEEERAILEESAAPSDGMPRGSGVSDPVEDKAMKRIRLREQNEIVDRALLNIPPEYRRAIWENVVYRKPYPQTANKNTFSMWRVRFVTDVHDYMIRTQGNKESV